MSPTTLTAGRSRPITSKRPRTAAAPDMSYFISSILSAGFSEMPPASKLTPLPTKQQGGSRSAPRYCNTMNRGSSLDPCATAMSAAIPSFSMAAGPMTRTRWPCSLPSLRATSARYEGVQRLPGSAWRSRARRCPSAIAAPTVRPRSIAARSRRDAIRSSRPRGLRSSPDCSSANRHAPCATPSTATWAITSGGTPAASSVINAKAIPDAPSSLARRAATAAARRTEPRANSVVSPRPTRSSRCT